MSAPRPSKPQTPAAPRMPSGKLDLRNAPSLMEQRAAEWAQRRREEAPR